MSIHKDKRNDDDRDNGRNSSLPVLRGWWSELSAPAKVLIPTSALMFVFVAVSAFPPLTF